MIIGLLAGMFWAIDTLLLGIALALPLFASNLLAPLVFTFIHDVCSTVILFFYKGVKKNRELIRIIKDKYGRLIIVGSLLGGPIGMSAYILSIYYIGSSYGAMLSSLFPAFGVIFSYLFLKEKVSLRQIIGLMICLAGLVLLSYSNEMIGDHMLIGILCGLVCAMMWSLETVIYTYVIRKIEVTGEQALQIRQTVSSLAYGLIFMNVLHLWPVFTSSISYSYLIIAASIFGVISYLCYYYAIHKIGPIKAMPLDITYSAWAIIFALVFLRQIPTLKECISAILIFLGALLCGI